MANLRVHLSPVLGIGNPCGASTQDQTQRDSPGPVGTVVEVSKASKVTFFADSLVVMGFLIYAQVYLAEHYCSVGSSDLH